MEDRNYLIILYDYYGEILKDIEKKYFEEYYFDNLSLSEIAANYNISRNAVHKHIKESEKKLLFYESKLSLYKKDIKIKKIINEVKDVNIKKQLLKLFD